MSYTSVVESGYFNGEKFNSETEIRDYFTIANMKAMFSGECAWTQQELNEMAEEVIENKWHCNF